jgi:hypothetical protein
MFGSGVLIVVFVLVAADPRVRDGASTLFGGGRPLAGLADLGVRLGGLVLLVEHVALGYGHDHSAVTMFALVAIVLVAAVFFLL